jgi:amino acid transporter
MTSPVPDRAPTVRGRIGEHAAWAMAVGGMIGGGIYTLAGVILGAAGPLAWLSLILGGLIALATVRSYARLTATPASETVPITGLAYAGRRGVAKVLALLLIGVYVLALAVYTFTFGHYLGRAFGLGAGGIALIEVAAVALVVALNLLGVQHPAKAQIVAVWIALAILGALAAIGFARWNTENLVRGVPAPSAVGVLVATAGTFIAFEGFEMLAYDMRELRRPRRVMRAGLAHAVIAVAIAYAVVTVGAASLVGADVLVRHQENALAVAGRAAAGAIGMAIVTIAACASALSAINATVFSVSRLARSTAEHGLLPAWCRRSNRHDAPTWSILAISAGALVVAMPARLGPLVQVASLGFLSLFCLVNTLAFRRCRAGRLISLLGAIGAGAGVVVVVAVLLD